MQVRSDIVSITVEQPEFLKGDPNARALCLYYKDGTKHDFGSTPEGFMNFCRVLTSLPTGFLPMVFNNVTKKRGRGRVPRKRAPA